MTVEASINRWLSRFKAGDQVAAQELWERYFRRLVGLARKKLQGWARRSADEEDVALSAFASFCRGVERGRFPRLNDQDDLWRLLVTITARKAYQLKLHQGRQKRAAKPTLDEAALGGSGTDDGPGLDAFLDAEPTPQMAALIAEEMQVLLDGLEDPELRAIAQWKLEGFTNEEIAGKLKVVTRTVERRLQDIRERLEEIRTRWLELSSLTEHSQVVMPSSPSTSSRDALHIVMRVTAGPNKGCKFSFSGHDMFIVGRSKDAHFRLPATDRYVSRIHFLVEVNPPFCRLVDMKSRHGTLLNGKKVQRAELNDGDKIQAGKTLFRIAIQPPDEAVVSDSELTHLYERKDPIPSAAASSKKKVVSKVKSAPLAAVATPKKSAGNASVCPVCEAARFTANQEMCVDCTNLTKQQAQPFAGYRIVRELGQGGFGTVFLALRQVDQTRVALKQLQPKVAGTRGQVDKFLREAAILKTLSHPNIVSFCDLGRGGDIGELIFFAMEYVPGLNGDQLLKKEKPLAVGRAVRLVRQLLKALIFAHEKGFVHRDIKPGNLIIADGDHVKLADFGLARVYQDSALSGLTLTGDVGGTMAYMAPEQLTEYRQAQPEVDQYAAAATLYRLLTAAWIYDLPKAFEDQFSIVLHGAPIPIRERRKDIPSDLAAVIHKALAKAPSARFANVEAFRRALKPFAG